MRQIARRAARHLSFAALFAGGSLVLYVALGGGSAAQRLTVATAYTGLGFLAATLLVGPLNERSGRPNPVSTSLRRDIGIWAAIGGILHTVVGLQVHMKGEIVRYFIPESGARVLSRGAVAFLAANYTGLVATLLLVLLLSISNDVSLRTLGPVRWKSIQRLNYLLAALVVVHGALYLAIGKLSLILVAAFVLIVVYVSQIQMRGRLSRDRSDVG